MSRVKFITTVIIRDEPSSSGEKLGKIYSGQTIDVIETYPYDNELWVSFNLDGETVFCCVFQNGEYFIEFNYNGEVSNSSNSMMPQNESEYEAVRQSGCCFLCACYLGGLNNIQEADKCFEWAVEKKKVKGNDAFVNMDKVKLAEQIAQHFGRQQRQGNFEYGNGHFYVVNNGVEVFNSVSPGYGHKKY
jgi:hypothetical protein